MLAEGVEYKKKESERSSQSVSKTVWVGGAGLKRKESDKPEEPNKCSRLIDIK